MISQSLSCNSHEPSPSICHEVESDLALYLAVKYHNLSQNVGRLGDRNVLHRKADGVEGELVDKYTKRPIVRMQRSADGRD